MFEAIWRHSSKRYKTRLQAKGLTQLWKSKGHLTLCSRISRHLRGSQEATALLTRRKRLKLKGASYTRCFWIHNFKKTWIRPKLSELKQVGLFMWAQHMLLLCCRRHRVWETLKLQCTSRHFKMPMVTVLANMTAQCPWTTSPLR